MNVRPSISAESFYTITRLTGHSDTYCLVFWHRSCTVRGSAFIYLLHCSYVWPFYHFCPTRIWSCHSLIRRRDTLGVCDPIPSWWVIFVPFYKDYWFWLISQVLATIWISFILFLELLIIDQKQHFLQSKKHPSLLQTCLTHWPAGTLFNVQHHHCSWKKLVHLCSSFIVNLILCKKILFPFIDVPVL